MATYDKSLVSVSDINRFRPVADLDQKRIDPYIIEAQRIELKQVLGDALHYDFFLKYGTVQDTDGNYGKLLRGTTYTFNSKVIEFSGLIPMISYYALARFFPNNPVNITKFGNTFKKNDFSEPLDAQTTKNITAELKSVAIMYQNEVLQFLMMNSDKYPIYSQSAGKEILNKTGIKFFDI